MARGQREKILVVQTSYLGDVVLTIPLLAEIRRRFPGSEVTVLCTPLAKSLLQATPHVQDIIADDKRGPGRGWAGLWRMAKELRSRGFTMAISPHKSFRTALLLFLAGVPRRIGFRQSAGWFFYHCLADRDSSRHDVERNLSILRPLGIDAGKCRRDFSLGVSVPTREAVARVFNSEGIEKKDGLMTFGLNPGSVWPTKRWSPEGYANLMIHLKKRYPCQILLFGSPEDEQTLAEIQNRCGHIGVCLAGKIGLQELPCALEWCDIFITNDSGPMHIAVARGIPVVAIFCATTPSLGFYPYSSRAVVVEKSLHCRPCSSHGGLRCPLGTEECIHGIGADDVLRGVEYLLNTGEVVTSASEGHHLPQFITL